MLGLSCWPKHAQVMGIRFRDGSMPSWPALPLVEEGRERDPPRAAPLVPVPRPHLVPDLAEGRAVIPRGQLFPLSTGALHVWPHFVF